MERDCEHEWVPDGFMHESEQDARGQWMTVNKPRLRCAKCTKVKVADVERPKSSTVDRSVEQ